MSDFPTNQFILIRKRNPYVLRHKGFIGAAGQIRTADLILTNLALNLPNGTHSRFFVLYHHPPANSMDFLIRLTSSYPCLSPLVWSIVFNFVFTFAATLPSLFDILVLDMISSLFFTIYGFLFNFLPRDMISYSYLWVGFHFLRFRGVFLCPIMNLRSNKS